MENEHVTCSIDSLSSKSELDQCCYICSIVVKTKSNLKAHLIKTHKIVESPNDEAFLRKKKSKLHRIYHCPVENCRYNISKNKGVNKFSVLKQHYHWVHMPHNFVCASCNKTFGTAPALKYHEKKCGIRFTCDFCGSDFAEEKFLTYHINRVHVKKDSFTSSEKSIKFESRPIPDDISRRPHILQPIYIPIILPMNMGDVSMLGSLQESTKSSIDLLQRLRLLRPDTKDQATQAVPPCQYQAAKEPLYQHPMWASSADGQMISCVPYNWSELPPPSAGPYYDDQSRMYLSQCHASMQTMPHHYDNFYNVETQTNLAGFVGRDFEGVYGGGVMGHEDLMSSFLPGGDPGGGGGSSDDLRLADSHTQTAKFALDFVDLSDIETQTNLQELDDLLFKN